MSDKEREKLGFSKVESVQVGSRLSASDIVKSGDFSTNENGSVFYSGRYQVEGKQELESNKNLAFDAVNSKNNCQMIQHTKAGASLNRFDKFNLVDPNEVNKNWKEASAGLARSAKGDVTAFTCGARKQDVFRSVELGELVKNEKVTNINGVSRDSLQKAFNENPDKAYAMVCNGEIKQAREKLNQLSPEQKPEFEKHLKGREQAFNKFLEENKGKFDFEKLKPEINKQPDVKAFSVEAVGKHNAQQKSYEQAKEPVREISKPKEREKTDF